MALFGKNFLPGLSLKNIKKAVVKHAPKALGVIGATVGTVLVPGLGTAAGAALGSAVGKVVGDNKINDMAQAAINDGVINVEKVAKNLSASGLQPTQKNIAAASQSIAAKAQSQGVTLAADKSAAEVGVKDSIMDKAKTFIKAHKKKSIIVGGIVLFIVLGVFVWKLIKRRKKGGKKRGVN